MKQYPKTYRDISRKPGAKVLSSIGSQLGSTDELARRFRSFYKDAHVVLFDLMVKEVWLEQQFLYDGARRGRSRNGYGIDWPFSYFMRSIVGISQKVLTTGFVYTTTPTYFKDFFPNFSDHNPFEEPEYFRYPYKNITLDHLSFVYQCHNRLELLDEAEKRSMNIQEFMDWVVNWVSCYSDENPIRGNKRMYDVVRHSFMPYIRRND